MRLLIAEDDAVTRLQLTATIERPVMDGAELCRRIRARPGDRYVYFILVPTRGGKQRYLKGMEAGADDFITKPVDPEELRARIKVAERILNLRHHVHRLVASGSRTRGGAGSRWNSMCPPGRRRSSVTGSVPNAIRSTSSRSSTRSEAF
jgi:PleD family two-component response regulator